MRHLNKALAFAGILSATSAFAADAPAPDYTITGNVGIFSQYVYRGLSQTDEKPALQGGLDYNHSSGFYIGAWGSNVSWFSDLNPGNSNSLELDTYLGFKNTFKEDFSYDVGFLRYNYPGSYPALNPGVVKPNTNELYAQLGWKMVTLKYSYAISDIFGVGDSKGTWYLDLSANFEIADKLNLFLHAGRQSYTGTAVEGGPSNNSLYSYSDYKIGLTKEWQGLNWGLAVTGTNANAAGYTIQGTNVGDTQVIASVAKTF